VVTTEVRIVDVDLDDDAHARAVVALLDHYARHPMGGGHPLAQSTREALIPGLRAQGHYVGVLAFRGATPVGLVNAFLGFSTFAARPLLNLHDVVVHESCRRQGIGRRLLARIEAVARARGCCKLTLEVRAANQAALGAYASSGFASCTVGRDGGVALFLEKTLTAEEALTP
jgi:ribosomal protein S18 acetylase RimI-like enzyme